MHDENANDYENVFGLLTNVCQYVKERKEHTHDLSAMRFIYV